MPTVHEAHTETRIALMKIDNTLQSSFPQEKPHSAFFQIEFFAANFYTSHERRQFSVVFHDFSFVTDRNK